MLWVVLVLAYGLIKGLREVLKKKALERNTVIEVLFVYTFLSFVIVIPEIRGAWGVSFRVLGYVALKSFAIFLAWLCGFKALDRMPVSLYGVIDLSRVVFSTLLGMIVLSEVPDAGGIAGLVLVLAGLAMLKLRPGHAGRTCRAQAPTVSGAKEPGSPAEAGPVFDVQAPTVPVTAVLCALASCFLNAVSGLSDKLLMSYTPITDGQLQFWYMLFLVCYYLIYIFATRQPIRWRSSLGNKWIWLLAVLFVVADRCLFIANADPESRVTVMTLIKQSGVIVTIICGRLVFKEKKIRYRLVCALVVLAGIAVSVL